MVQLRGQFVSSLSSRVHVQILIEFCSYDAWVVAFPQEYVGTDVVKTASRLIPRSVFQDDDLRNQMFAALKDGIVEQVRCFYFARSPSFSLEFQ